MDAIGVFHQLVSGPRPVVVILAVGTRFLAQLQIHLPDLVAAAPDDKVTIPLETAGRIGAFYSATTATPDLDLTVIFPISSDITHPDPLSGWQDVIADVPDRKGTAALGTNVDETERLDDLGDLHVSPQSAPGAAD